MSIERASQRAMVIVGDAMGKLPSVAGSIPAACYLFEVM